MTGRGKSQKSLDLIAAAGVPSFPTADKRRDPRHAWYLHTYGGRCWELDALNPRLLRERVERAIQAHLDVDAWQHAVTIEQAQREATTKYAAGFRDISMPATKCSGGHP